MHILNAVRKHLVQVNNKEYIKLLALCDRNLPVIGGLLTKDQLYENDFMQLEIPSQLSNLLYIVL